MLNPQILKQAAICLLNEWGEDKINGFIQESYFIVSAPRAGSTLLFEQMIQHQDIYSIGRESHIIFAMFDHLRFENDQLDSGTLLTHHADKTTQLLIKAAFILLLQNNRHERLLDKHPSAWPERLVFLEKTPRNALNMGFLRRIFKDPKFIYLHRKKEGNIASIAEAWQLGLKTGQFVTYKNLPAWDKPAWCLLLPRGWRELKGHGIVDIAAFQWAQSNLSIINNLESLEENKWCVVRYEDIISKPMKTLEAIYRFMQVSIDHAPQIKELAHSKTTVSKPDPNKWKKYEKEIELASPFYEAGESAIAQIEESTSRIK